MPALASSQLPRRRYSLGLGLSWEVLRYFKYWIIAVLILSFLGPLALSRYTDIDLSAWFYTANVAKWFSAFVGGGFVYVLVPSLIAAGVTRRELAVSLGVFGTVWSAGIGAAAIGGLLTERFYYGAMGWTQAVELNEATAPIGTWGETLGFAAVYPLLYLAYFTAGTVIGVASYRWDGTGWLLVVPILPVLFSLDNALYNTKPFGPGWLGFLGRFVDEAGRGLVLAAIVLVIAALAASAYRILIDIPLRSKKA
ncbi:hypothetical protein [Glycomyces sp. NRRL B-16210]|uniref:hypothetical protein n=1 Tax=Glycomyces sp. NRRL B-16210 TaxID=1463821 RepID=UPI0004C20E7E|nr:hypothetical protein [Glycomyces sp. NRRL B-16210]